MTRTEAIARIHRGLGFRTGLDSVIIDALREAQRDLENGKTLPPFLLQESAVLNLLVGTNTVALPTRFIRVEVDPHFTPLNEESPTFLVAKSSYEDALAAYASEPSGGPAIYVVRRRLGVLDFIVTADRNYTLTWSYYRGAESLAADVENDWLANFNGRENPGADWLMGRAGYIVAKDLRDKDAMATFDDMATRGRAALLGEIIAQEDDSGPYVMGANL